MKRYILAATLFAATLSATAAQAQSCPAIDVSPAAISDATLNQAYLATLSATGGAAPYAYGVKTGSLPPGLRIFIDRVRGTPTAAGTYSFTIIAIDQNACTGTHAYTMKVIDPAAGCQPVTLSPSVIPAGSVGQLYSARFTAFSATSTSYTFSFKGTLPAGLGFFNQVLTGTPSTAGVSEFDIVATDSAGCTGTQHYELQVLPAGCPRDTATMFTPVSGGSFDASQSIPFTWSQVPGATRYEVLVSVDGGLTFETVAATADASVTSAPVILGPGSYFAVVRAIFSADCSTRSALAQFKVGGTATCGTTPPSPIEPKNNDSTNSTSVVFSWTAVANATSYEVFTSLNDGPFTDMGGTSGTSLTRLLQAGTIDWYVEARFATCSAIRSSTTRFTVAPSQCGGGSIALQSPANGSTVQSPVTLSWTGVSGASAYRVWAGMDGHSAIPVARVTTTTATLPLPNGSAEWYVEALFDNCPSVVSPHGKFNVQRASSCGSAAPALVSPVGTSSSSPVTFQWNAAAGAAAYHLWIAPQGEAFTDAGLTTDTQIRQALTAGAYSWYVDAIYAGCPSVSSSTASFQVSETAAGCSGQAPVILTPVGNASPASPVTFTWTAVDGASEYRVFASVGGGPFKLAGRSDDPSLTRPVPAGSIVWFVEAAFDGCASTHSQPSRFTVPQATNCPKDQPSLLSPAAGANDVASPVMFSWTPVAGAVRYLVVTKPARGTATVIGNTSATQLGRDIPAGDLEWWVIALGSGCNGVASEHGTFSVPNPAGCDSRRPHPLAPADDSAGVASPVHFAWTKSANAKSYRLLAAIGGNEPALIATTTSNEISVPMPPGNVRWSVQAVFDSCPSLFSAFNDLKVAAPSTSCQAPRRPGAHVVAQVLSGTDYNVRWNGVPNAGVYELQESPTPDFANAVTTTVTGVSAAFTHTASAGPVPYYYRVRAVSACSEDRSAFSRVATTRIIPPNTNATRERPTADLSSETPIVTTIDIAPQFAGAQFTAATNRPWMTVTPPVGTVPATGQTLTVTSQPSGMIAGSNQGAVHLNFSSSSNSRMQTDSTTPATVPISVSLVTPVAPDTPGTPLPTSLIIPAIAHGPGANGSLFESDIRLANVSSQAMTYLINFTPTATDGTKTGTTTTIQVDPGASIALNDILSSYFGTPSGGGESGMLEIRPLTDDSSSSLFSAVPDNLFSTVASSRTYNVTSLGTFGQFIPAIPFSQFVGKGSVLSLQQIAQSSTFRTNFGLVEAAGEPADVILHVFDKSGNLLADIPQSLLPSEHLQLNGLLSANDITLDDGRVEVEVTSSTGKVSAYASVVDSRTNDPLLVSPVLKGSISSNRYVIPGVAYTNTLANWRTDARLYNSALTGVTATLTYYPQSGSSDMTPVVRTSTIAPGETKDLDNILNTTFGITATDAGGSVLITTPEASSIIASARTYALAGDGGTIGQFVPAVTPTDSVGAGERSLQLLQLESSDGFRTNIGLAETAGSNATAEVSLVLPDSKLTPVISVPLGPNEFVQFPLSSFGIPNPLYNARVSVRVVDGTGRVTAYGSLVDNVSQDPTYVPAQ